MLIAFNKPYGVLCQFTDDSPGRAGSSPAGRKTSASSHGQGSSATLQPRESSSQPAARPTLAGFGLPPRVYPAGRLDHDSEGLLLLTDDGVLAHRLTDPRHKQPKTYWVQVEGVPDPARLDALRRGPVLNDGPTRPARVEAISEPALWPRDPPIRVRKTVPDAWLAITLTEGRNRQIRRMTAAVGLPTLRLVRASIGGIDLQGLMPGAWRPCDAAGPLT